MEELCVGDLVTRGHVDSVKGLQFHRVVYHG